MADLGETGAVAEAGPREEPAPAAGAAAPAPAEYHPGRPLVLGGGPAGMAAVHSLRAAGISPVVIEAGDAVCMSWREAYEGLALNSTRRLSSLPGKFFDRRSGPWVASEDLVAYTERYARRLAPDIRFGHRVEAIRRDGGGWAVVTSRGELWSPWVVVALGLNNVPFTPPWPGREGFTGRLLHAREFRRAAEFAGRKVLVVGVGASGTDIAVQLARAGSERVWLSVRTPPLVMRRHLSTAVLSQVIKEGRRPPRFLVDRSGILIHKLLWGDMSRYGLATPTEGLATALDRRGHGSTVDRGLMSAIRGGHVTVLPAVEGFDGADVLLANGSVVRPDAVVAATGQRTGLRRLLAGLDVLQHDERPRVHGAATAPEAPDLYFLGYRLPAGQLLDLRIDAPAIARRLARVLR